MERRDKDMEIEARGWGSSDGIKKLRIGLNLKAPRREVEKNQGTITSRSKFPKNSHL